MQTSSSKKLISQSKRRFRWWRNSRIKAAIQFEYTASLYQLPVEDQAQWKEKEIEQIVNALNGLGGDPRVTVKLKLIRNRRKKKDAV